MGIVAETPLSNIEYWMDYAYKVTRGLCLKLPKEAKDEAEGIADEALSRALRDYNPRKATKFSAYLRIKIHYVIQHYCRDKQRHIKIPAWHQERFKDYENYPTTTSLDAVTEAGFEPNIESFENETLERLSAHHIPLEVLTEKQQKSLEVCFNINGCTTTPTEYAKIHGISRMVVYHTKDHALRKLRKAMGPTT